MKYSAVIVTRGDVDLGPCLSGLDADEIIIRRGHLGVWERFEAAAAAKHEVIYTQDDDCVVEAAQVMAHYDPSVVVCNMPGWKRYEYPDGIALIGWGAVFHRSALEVFERYRQKFPADDAVFRREADRVFTGLNSCKLIDVPFTNLPCAYGKDRLAARPEHSGNLIEIRKRIFEVRANG